MYDFIDDCLGFSIFCCPDDLCRPPAGRGAVCRDHPEPGQREAVRRVWSCIYTEIQPGQILPGLCGADAPEERGGTAAEKIPVFVRKKIIYCGSRGVARLKNAGHRANRPPRPAFSSLLNVSLSNFFINTFFQLLTIGNINSGGNCVKSLS